MVTVDVVTVPPSLSSLHSSADTHVTSSQQSSTVSNNSVFVLGTFAHIVSSPPIVEGSQSLAHLDDETNHLSVYNTPELFDSHNSVLVPVYDAQHVAMSSYKIVVEVALPHNSPVPDEHVVESLMQYPPPVGFRKYLFVPVESGSCDYYFLFSL